VTEGTARNSKLQGLFAGLFLLVGSLGFWSIYSRTIDGERPFWADFLVPLVMILFVLQNWLAPSPSLPPRWRQGFIVVFSAMAVLQLVAIFALKGM
jgi:hypothetical protein